MSTLTDSRAAGVDVKEVHEVSTAISVDECRGQVELLSEEKEDREESSVKAEQGPMKLNTEELPSVRSPCQSCDPGNVLKVEADQLQHHDIYQHKENPTNPCLQDIRALQHLNYKHVAPMGLSHHQGQQPQQHPSVMDNFNRQMKRHEVKGGCGSGQYPGQVVVGHQQQQVRPDHGDQALNHLSAQLRSVLDFSCLPTLEEALSPSGMTSPARQR